MSSVLPPFPSDVATVNLETISLAKLASYDRAESAKLFDACTKLGFLYVDLRGHPEGEKLIEQSKGVFDIAGELSRIPAGEREQYRSSDNVCGYKAQKLDAGSNRTFAFNTAIDDLLNDAPLRSLPPLMSAEQHRPFLAESARVAQTINLLILTHLERGLAVAPGSFTKLHSSGERTTSSHLSITATPPAQPGDARRAFNAHSDHGSVTLVMHNVLGGLQVLVPNSYATGSDEPGASWKYVKPLPGHAIVNLGDVMPLLTNSLYRSNVHRVLDPPGEQAGHTRYSLVYFLYPVDDFTVPLESVIKLDHSKGNTGEVASTSTAHQLTFKEFISRRLGVGKGDEETEAYHVKGREPGIFGERERALLAMAGED